MKLAVIQFPGSNCDMDAVHAGRLLGLRAQRVWHKETSLEDFDAVIVPGGFSYGDYLRCGAIARFAPIMAEVKKLAQAGAPVLGICNGFQVLCEAGLLPGALVRNAGMRFVCQDETLIAATQLGSIAPGTELTLPIAHGEGNYTANEQTLAQLQAEDQVLLRYKAHANPNGSAGNIAGVRSAAGNVWGMMPHPERAVETPVHPATCGVGVLQAWLESAAAAV